MLVAGIDPGFASLGYCFYDTDKDVVVKAGVLCTCKDRQLLAREDNARRFAELWSELNSLWPSGVSVVYVEGMSQPRDSRASWKLALGWGVILGLCNMRHLKMIQVGSMAAKKVVTGKGTASKAEVIEAIRKRFPELKWPSAKTIHEHFADSIAVALSGVELN